MSDTPANIDAAKRFAIALVSNVKLLNAFLAAERKIIQIDPAFETAALDNFLVQNHYDCTMDQVATYGKPILSDLTHWAGTYSTKTSADGSTLWVDGPTIVIGSDGSVTVNGLPIANPAFSFLNLTWANNSLVFYMAADPSQAGQRLPAVFGYYSGFHLIGLSQPAPQTASNAKDQSTFLRVVGVVNKYLGQINQAFMMYDLIKKAASLQPKANAGDPEAMSELGEIRGPLSQSITEVSQSQGEIATTQQSAIDAQLAADPSLTPEAASAAIRAAQADELGVEAVEDVEAAQLNPGGEAIAEASVEEGGLEFAGAEFGEEAVGEMAVDFFLEDALVLLLL